MWDEFSSQKFRRENKRVQFRKIDDVAVERIGKTERIKSTWKFIRTQHWLQVVWERKLFAFFIHIYCMFSYCCQNVGMAAVYVSEWSFGFIIFFKLLSIKFLAGKIKGEKAKVFSLCESTYCVKEKSIEMFSVIRQKK
jgi:hypothetical protein